MLYCVQVHYSKLPVDVILKFERSYYSSSGPYYTFSQFSYSNQVGTISRTPSVTPSVSACYRVWYEVYYNSAILGYTLLSNGWLSNPIYVTVGGGSGCQPGYPYLPSK